MSGFDDPAVHRVRQDRAALAAPRRSLSGGPLVTVEIGHPGTRQGIVVELGVGGGSQLRALMERVFDRAGALGEVHPTDPGWWAGIISATSAEMVGWGRVQRTVDRLSGHAVLVVEHRRMVETGAGDWPLLRLAPTGRLVDLRGESCLRWGPSDAELAAYRDRSTGVDIAGWDPVRMRRMFEAGVILWQPGDVKRGRRGLHAAGQR